MAKTNKSILKRARITKRGKILIAGKGMNHYQAKKRRSAQLKNKQLNTADPQTSAMIASYLYHG